MTTEWMPVQDDVLELVELTIAEHERFTTLAEANICVMFRMGSVPTSKGREVWGRAEKFPDKMNAILRHSADVDYDFLVWFTYSAWITLNNKQKQALVFHELCHCEMEWSDSEDEYMPKIVGHDVEMFVDEYRLFGAWRPELAEIEQAVRQERLPGLHQPAGTVATLRFGDGSARPVADLEQLTEAVERVTP